MNKEKIGKFTVKQVGAESDRTLRFIGTDESEDRDGDIIKADGWDLENFQKNPVFLPFHDYGRVPIGKCIAVNKSTGSAALVFDIKFPSIDEFCTDVNHPSHEFKLSDTVYMAYKNGYMNAVSVGFIGNESIEREDQKDIPAWQRGRIFTSQELLELSAVSVPSNPNALLHARSAKGVNQENVKLLEEIFKEAGRNANNKSSSQVEPGEIPNTASIEVLTNENESKEAEEMTAEIKAYIDEQLAKQMHADTKAGAKISAETKKQMEECFGHMEKGYASIANAQSVLKGLMDGTGEEPAGNVSEKPGTEQTGNSPNASDDASGKMIDLNQIDFEKYESLLPKAE